MNVCLMLAVALVVRLCCPNACLAQALGIIPLVALYGYCLYLDTKKVAPVNDQVLADVQMLKDTLTALKISRSYGSR